MFLKKELEEVRKQIVAEDKLNKSVSQASVFWHIDHMLKVINRICKALEESDPGTYIWRPSLAKFVVFTFQRIPRGKAKAPKSTLPPDNIEHDELVHQLKLAIKNLDAIEGLPSKSYFKHHIFGNLDFKDSIKMLKVHTRHHLRIIDDIRGKA